MKKLTTLEYVTKAKTVHGNKYDYSLVIYNGLRGKIKIICPKHGEFIQRAGSHLNGQGCPNCFRERLSAAMSQTREQFITKAATVHKGKYDYSKVEYINSSQKVEIICPKHGTFKQAPAQHISGQGCPKCKAEKTRETKRDTQEDFISKARHTHGDKYDYSKVNYIDTRKKVCIICPNGHEFWQMPSLHIFGKGCPVCLESLGEQLIRETLNNRNIQFIAQKRFPDWLGKQSLDFFLPDLSIGIEHQGKQHFTPVKQWGNYKWMHEKDLTKQRLCKEHGITILYLTSPDVYNYPTENWEWMKPYLFTDISQIIDYIEKIK